LLPLRQRRHPARPLLRVAELVDVVGAQGVVGGDTDPDRRIDLGQLGDDEDVFDVAEAGAAEVLGEDDAQEAELARLGHHLAGELLALVDDGVDFTPGELPGGLLDGALFVGQGKIHGLPPSGPLQASSKRLHRGWAAMLSRRVRDGNVSERARYDSRVIRAVLFDFNGVLVDDEPIHLEAFQRVLGEEGVTLTADDYYGKYLVHDDRSCFAAVLTAAGEQPAVLTIPRLMRLIARKSSYYQERIRERGYPLFPGAAELVRELAAAGRMLGIVSGALRDEVEGALRQSGLRNLFKVLITAEDVAEGKP